MLPQRCFSWKEVGGFPALRVWEGLREQGRHLWEQVLLGRALQEAGESRPGRQWPWLPQLEVRCWRTPSAVPSSLRQNCRLPQAPPPRFHLHRQVRSHPHSRCRWSHNHPSPTPGRGRPPPGFNLNVLTYVLQMFVCSSLGLSKSMPHAGK